MSTKIYNGYRHKKVSTDELFDLFVKLREEFNMVSQKLINDLARNILVDSIDQLSIGIDINKDKKINYISKDSDVNIKSLIDILFMDMFSRAFDSKERCVMYDLGINCCVLKTDLDPDYLYFIFYYENKKYEKVISKYFEPYPYWDNTDHPEKYSYEEWEKIGEKWHDALKYQYVPSLNGFVMEFNNKYSLPNPQWEEIVKDFPKKEIRVENLAKKIVKEILFGEEKSSSTQDLIKNIEKISYEIKNNEHDDKIKKVISELNKILPNLDENTDLSLKIYETYYKENFDKKALIGNL